jgi:hypothetical protein
MTKDEICPKCGLDCKWMDRYLYRCVNSFEHEHYRPFFGKLNNG